MLLNSLTTDIFKGESKRYGRPGRIREVLIFRFMRSWMQVEER